MLRESNLSAQSNASDFSSTLDLIDQVCFCLAHTSDDEDNSAVRYGRQIEALKRKLSGLHDIVSLYPLSYPATTINTP
jgi:hypothetical protein